MSAPELNTLFGALHSRFKPIENDGDVRYSIDMDPEELSRVSHAADNVRDSINNGVAGVSALMELTLTCLPGEVDESIVADCMGLIRVLSRSLFDLQQIGYVADHATPAAAHPQREPVSQLSRSDSELDSRPPILTRDDLSFTRRDEHGRLINWAVPHDQEDNWGDGLERGKRFFGEIVEIAQTNEEEARDAVLHALASPYFSVGWGEEHGFAVCVADAAIRAIRKDKAVPSVEGE